MDSPSGVPQDAAQPSTQSAAPRRERLKLSGIKIDREQSGRFTARVQLEWDDGRVLAGQSEGMVSTLGEYRVVAEATLRAVKSFLAPETRLELLGVKPLRVFDAGIVIVAVGHVNNTGSMVKLLGVDHAETDTLRSAAKAVLSATNRLVASISLSQPG